MVSTELATARTPISPNEISLDLIGLELSLEAFNASQDDFSGFVQQTAEDFGGELLFTLPASGLVRDCKTIAVLRLPMGASGDMQTVFACLNDAGTSVRVEEPNERSAGLARFAHAFIDVLEKF